jgi:hypothetical protein
MRRVMKIPLLLSGFYTFAKIILRTTTEVSEVRREATSEAVCAIDVSSVFDSVLRKCSNIYISGAVLPFMRVQVSCSFYDYTGKAIYTISKYC